MKTMKYASRIGHREYRRGFTIVELLIVIVIIGILATIAIVSFNGIQAKARDSQRLQDAKTIVQALEIYKTQNGIYPDEVQTVGAWGWELSTTGSSPTNFLSALVSSANGVSRVPLDPRNTISGGMDPNNNEANYMYFYHNYPAGSSGCSGARGNFYVFGITRMESVPSGGTHATSPGFSCSGQNWGATRGAWVTGGYTN